MLPSPLWDLLLHRAYLPFNCAVNQFVKPRNARYLQKLLTRPKLSAGPNVPSTNWSESISNVEPDLLPFDDHLKAVMESESHISTDKYDALAKLNEETQEYQVEETQLQSIYQDLFSSVDVTPDRKDDGIKTDIDRDLFMELLYTLEERFEDMPSSPKFVNPNSLSAQLLHDLSSSPLHISKDTDTYVLLDLGKATSDISASLRLLVNKLESYLRVLDPISWPTTDAETPTLSLGLLSKPEWGMLIRGALAEDDTATAERILGLMKMAGEQPTEEHYDSIMNWYANQGLVEEADMFCSRLSLDLSRDRQRDLLIKARLKANKLDEACKMLYSFESNATPAPMQSYTRVIRAMLFHTGPGAEQSKAQAWDMFSHMRYAAHPVPDEFLYSTMIRSIAESQDPEAERALDLFTEMTIDNKIPPTLHSYNAIILVCARSKKYRMEAFRFAREMLNSHTDANGEVPASLRPNKHTFMALLEAAKRLGDLNRTRWILTQLIKETRRSLRSGAKTDYVDEKIMEHVFHAYASYMPPFHRNIAPEQKEEQDEGQATEKTVADTQDPPSRNIEKSSQFGSHTPQTHQEVLREVSMLWNRILDDVESAETGSFDEAVFGRVSINTKLVNSYISVFFAHSPPDTAFNAFRRVYEELGVPRNARSYLIAFDAYILGKRCTKREMQAALEHARALWPEWLALEDSAYPRISAQGMDTNRAVNARMVEKVWNSMFRLLAHNDCLDEAMNLVREFVKRYPPSLVKVPSPSDPSRSPKTSLYARRPLVRLVEQTTIPEDRIPPFLLFKDLELLHNRSVSAKRRDYVNYIKWVASAYAGALRQRQRLTYGAANSNDSSKSKGDVESGVD